MKRITIFCFFSLIFIACRPQIDTQVSDSTVFDYNFNGFTTEKSDTIKSSVWVNYELYLKPISTSLLKEVNKTILVKPVIDKDVKVLYQLFDVENKAISSEQRTGDVSSISSEHMMEHKVLLKIKVLPPSEMGKLGLTINTTWNGVSKSILKSVVVVP
jgi:hypothetical protein